MIITLLSISTALLVVSSTSTVYSVLWLVATFLIISALLGLLNLGFTALLYIIVYVGAIAILFLFVVQLLDLGSTSEQPGIETTKSIADKSKGIAPLAIVISLALLSILIVAGFVQLDNQDNVQSLFYNGIDTSSVISTKINTISSTLSTSVISSVPGNSPQVQSIAQWFYGPGLLPLIIISIILLVSMIAPISLCKDNE